MLLKDTLFLAALNHHYAGNAYEAGGNTEGAAQLRAVENLLHAYVQDHEECAHLATTVLPFDNPFRPWDGDYEKVHYDVLLKDGTMRKWCWPNAGKFHDGHGDGRTITAKEILGIRESPNHPLDEL